MEEPQTTPETIAVPKAELAELLRQNKEMKQDAAQLLRQNKEMKQDAAQIREFIIGIMRSIGIAGSDGKITAEFEKEENKMAVIMKSVMGIGSDLMTMNVPIVGRAAKARVEAFTEKIKMDKILPILKKYANE